MPTIPADVWAQVKTVHARFAPEFPGDEHGAREFMRLLIGQVAFSFPDQGWCWKKSSPTAPPSKDCLARQEGGRLEGWDILVGAGAQGPRVLSESPAYHDLAGQHHVEVEARDVLGAPPVHDAPEPADPALRPEIAQAVAALRSIAAQLAALPAPGNDAPACQLPHHPVCTKPHSEDGPTYTAMMAMIAGAQAQVSERLGGDFLAHLVWRFLREGYTHDQLVEQARQHASG